MVRNILSAIVVTLVCLPASISASPAPRFEGTITVSWEIDGRHMQLLSPIAFIDSKGMRWDVPKGATVDGASIPRFLWAIVGGPFEGPYRDASVIHDWYCDVRTRPWLEVDRMFYEAMVARGVNETQAKVMYLAVVYGGPRWDDQTIANNLLNPSVRAARKVVARPRRPRDGYTGVWNARPTKEVLITPAPGPEQRFAAMAAQVKENNLSLEAIDALAEADPLNVEVYGPERSPPRNR